MGAAAGEGGGGDGGLAGRAGRGGGRRALELARRSGLVPEGKPLLVLLSGGADSVCLLDVALELGAQAAALHVNYGLRPGADADESFCRELCERLGVELAVERAELSAARGEPGNVQAQAREARYARAESWSREHGAGYATAHTATDQAETVLYRLAASPGRRALLGMPPRRGRHVRPLLAATRAETRAWCEARGLAWREDPSNVDPRYARTRIRSEVLPVLAELNPAAELNIAETAALLADEAEVLERAVGGALERIGGAGAPAGELRALPPALARLVLRRLAERAAGGPRALSRDDADAILALSQRGGTRTLDLGGGLRAVSEYGVVRFTTSGEAASPEPVRLPVPGVVRFGRWEVEARVREAGGEVSPVAVAEQETGGEALLDPGELGSPVLVRPWRPGDRMRPAGLGGSKSLQDLFTDRKVPRMLRGSLPVVEAHGEIAWVAGVATAERFRARPGARRLVALSARRRAE